MVIVFFPKSREFMVALDCDLSTNLQKKDSKNVTIPYVCSQHVGYVVKTSCFSKAGKRVVKRVQWMRERIGAFFCETLGGFHVFIYV